MSSWLFSRCIHTLIGTMVDWLETLDYGVEGCESRLGSACGWKTLSTQQ